jgi:putative transposase
MYPTDLTDAQWLRLKPLLIEKTGSGAKGGRPPKQDVRQEVNGILYVLKTGCQWRLLPKEFGHWSKVYARFRRWRLSGVWERVLIALREQERERRGKKAQPSVAIIDSQSVKTTGKGRQRGFDAGKKNQGT